MDDNRIDFFQKKSQSVLEYALIISCVVLALLAMQRYIKRGMQGNLRSAADGLGRQYDPDKSTGYQTDKHSSAATTWTRISSEALLGFDLDEDNKLEHEVYGETANTSSSAHSSIDGYDEGIR